MDTAIRPAILGLLACFQLWSSAGDYRQCTPAASNDPVRRIGQLTPDRNGIFITTARQHAGVLETNYKVAPIFIAKLLYPANSWYVALSGRQLFIPDQATTTVNAIAAFFGKNTEYSDLIIRAMTEMRIPRSAKILMVGHSLGGAEACNLVLNRKYDQWHRWWIDRLITFGTPPVHYVTLDARDVRRFMILNDPVRQYLRYVMPTAVSDLGLIFVDSGGRNTISAHVAYPYSAALRNYDAYGDQGGSRYAELDTHNMYRCEAKKEALNYPVGSSDSGFDQLAQFRNSQGLPQAGSPGDTSTVAMLVMNGQRFFGVNSALQNPKTTITIGRVNPQTLTHAEADSVQQAINAGLAGSAGQAEMWIDRDPCWSCGASGGLRSLTRNLGVSALIAHYPSGARTFQPTQ